MRCKGRLGYAVCDVMGWTHSGDDEDTIFELRTPLYGMIDAQDLFDEYFETQLVDYGLVMACEDITKHIWVKVPPTLRASVNGIPRWEASDISFSLGKYVDDTRYGGQGDESIQFEIFLEDTIGLRESGKVSKMLSKEYDLGKSLDGKFSHRMTMHMQPTIQKYVRDMKEICLEKKIALERETQAALDPEVGAAEVRFSNPSGTEVGLACRCVLIAGARNAARDPSNALTLHSIATASRANDHRDGARNLQAGQH